MEFRPLFKNPHAATIAGNFWPRPRDLDRFPLDRRLIPVGDGVEVLVLTQRPLRQPRGQLFLLHGLEGSSSAGYMHSMAHEALQRGYIVHRGNMRGCGGTEKLSPTTYHAGLTNDWQTVLEVFRKPAIPSYLVGFSLGGNVVLKLAGELGACASGLLSAVCAVSAPIDLAACVRSLNKRENWLYQHRFVKRLKQRVREKYQVLPNVCPPERLAGVQTVYAFDDTLTAPAFGFDSADHYYETQSAVHFVGRIRIPTLLVQAKDDPLVPFDVYRHPALTENPLIKLKAVEHGGHLGFLARSGPRFWLDHYVLDWFGQLGSATIHNK